MSDREQFPRIISHNRFLDDWNYCLLPYEARAEVQHPLLLRHILPKAVRLFSAFAVETQVSIISVEDRQSEYAAITYEFANDCLAGESQLERTITLDAKGHILDQYKIWHGHFKRLSVGQDRVGYLLNADPEWREITEELSARYTSGWPELK